MSKIANVITMLNLLSNGRKYTIEELSNILEVTPRMVRSYREELEKAGIYIDSIMGPYGGYVLNQTVKLPERKFSKEDYEILEEYIKIENNPRLLDLKDKIMGVYISNEVRKESLAFNPEIIEKYNILTRAIKEKRKVRILYHSFQKGDNERIIHPASMFLFQDGWYFAAFCELRKDIRHFELKRIKQIELLEENF